MSNRLADKLVGAATPEHFLREQGGSADWTVMAALKGEVDDLLTRDIKAASRLAERVERLAPLIGDPISRAFAEICRARILYDQGRHLEANTLYDNGIDALRAGGLVKEAAMIQVQQVDALKYLGRYDDALRTARAARRQLSRAGPAQLAQLETNVGNVYYQQDRYKIALEHYERARQMLSSAGDDTMRALVDFSRSNILIELDRPDEAMALLEGAAAAYDRAGKGLRVAQLRCQIAYLQYQRGNYNAALASYYQARDSLVELGSQQDVAFFNLDMAEVLLALSAFEDSAASSTNAREGFTRLGMMYEAARSMMLHALAALGLRQFEQAHGDLTAARKVFNDSRNTTFTAMADSYMAELALRRGDAAEAERRADLSLRVFMRQKLVTRSAYSRLQKAHAAYQSGQPAKAARAAKAALGAVEAVFAPGVVYRCCHLMGRIERDRGRGLAALDNFRRAVETVEQMRGGIAADDFKATFLTDKMEVYEDCIAACLDLGNESLLEEAFRLVESSKSRALADLLARYVRGSQKSTPPRGRGPGAEARARLSKLIEDLNWYSSNAGVEDDKGDQRSADVADRYRRAVARCERQIAQLFRRMEAEGSPFADIQRMQAASSVDLRRTLEQGETAIEYFMAGDEISAFVATPEQMTVVRGLASKKEVEPMLAALRFQIEKFNYGSAYVDAHFGQLKRATDDHLGVLYRSVFELLERKIHTEKLIIIPHGPLHYVPFHALHDGKRYLVDDYEISYAPSASVLKLCRSRPGPVKGDTFVALGVAERETPGIDDELRALGAIFPNAVKLAGAEATRDNLMRVAPRARFLHLASHGNFRRDNPMFSFLKLADSRLNFYSLLDLRLNAEMVTLSACRTGVNMVFPGDELHGLMRGFLYAGAPSMVVSLWAVSDRSTAELMGEMYSHIRAADTKRTALRRAQLAIKDAYGHPYYWAPFILMGNPV